EREEEPSAYAPGARPDVVESPSETAEREEEPSAYAPGARPDVVESPSETAEREEEPSAYAPGARPDVVESLRETAERERHASDGGGRAWVERTEPTELRVGIPAQITLGFEVGPEGIAEGGMIFLQGPPFWGWTPPQTHIPELPGYTTVESDAEGVELIAETVTDQQVVVFEVSGRALKPGERLRFVYGAGPAGTSVDRFAEAESPFFILVDGDGDGFRTVLSDPPTVPVHAGPPARLVVNIPSVARPGEHVRVHLAVLDAQGSRGVDFEGELALRVEGTGLELEERVVFTAADGGVKVVEGRATGSGTVRVHASTPEGFAATSNALVLSSQGPRILWADLHGHSVFSDGTGTPEDYYAYARDVAGLDIAVLTDHDHWGIQPLVSHPALWQRIRTATEHYNAPGRFVTLLGFEWTSWLYGHRHVIYFDDKGTVIDSVALGTQSPQELWKALEGTRALTFAHHSAGGPIATDWRIAPDPRFEPVTEIASVHGSSEALDSPHVIYDPVPGNFARDALGMGYRLGFVGSGDTHDGHPGLGQLASTTGGLAAVLAEENTREAVREALVARRVYATNGPRILLRAALGTARMGESLAAPDKDIDLYVNVVGTGPLERLDVVRSGEIASLALEEALDTTVHLNISGLQPGEWLYVRVVQADGGVAWSSPFFID
ncbi:MAG: hypothetical protein CL938_03515, partial [Deltaproteobacteria bacterium]|nr:hypothetical protein [Deltaproteobacteria bacterium]